MSMIPLLINRLEGEGENKDTPLAIVEAIDRLTNHSES